MRRSRRHSRSATTLIAHIRELQKRLLISFIVLVGTGVLVYFFYGPILDLLRSPLNAPLFYSTPAGSFAFVMKICFMGALTLSIPVLIFNLIMFIRPAFEQHIKTRQVVAVSAFSALFALAGAAFGFLYIIPRVLHFFAGFQVDGLNALISADGYLGFVTNVIITFVLVFQLPLVIMFIDRIKPIKPSSLLRGEKWIVLGSLGVSVLVPFAFDLVTSLLIALPIVILYNLSIALVLLQHALIRNREKMLHRKSNMDNVPVSTLSLYAPSFDEPIVQQQPRAAVALLPTTVSIKRTPTKRAGMDVRPSKHRPESVKPAAWVHRVRDPIPLNSRVRMVTDIHRRVSI